MALIPDEPASSVQAHQANRPAISLDNAGIAGGVDLRDLLALLKRNILWLVLAMLAGGALGVTAGMVLPKRYLAEGLLVIDTREVAIPEFQSIRSTRTVEPWGGRSEARVLDSPEMVSAVVTKLDLQHDPHFNPTLRAVPIYSWLSKVAWLPESWRDALRQTPEFGPQIQTRIVHEILKNLTVFSEERNYAIGVRYTSYDPVVSANFVNELMQTYLNQDVHAKRRALDQARVQLRQRLEELHSDLQGTRTRIRSVEGSGDALETLQGTISAQQTAEIALERLHIANERAHVEVDAAQIDAGLASGQISVTNEKLITPRLEALWKSEAALQRQLAETGSIFAATSQKMQQIRNGLAKVQFEIRNEVTAIRGGLQQRIITLTSREKALERKLSDSKAVASMSAADRALLNQLKAEATSKQSLYDEYRKRYEQTVANAALITPDARVASKAAPPIKPYPSLFACALIGATVGLLIAIALVTSRRWLRDRLETLDDAQRICGAAPLGGIPQVGGWIRRANVTDLVLDEPHSALAATIRGILYQIALGRPQPAKVVMVTSPLSRDGKSTLVAAMVRIGARDGMRCLALECDFYRPSLARKINATPLSYLNDETPPSPVLSEMITEDRASGAHFVMAKASAPDQFGILPRDAERIRQIVEAARQDYDLIVIDTPPSLSVIDPLILSEVADGMVVVLPWRTISNRRAREAMQRLSAFACPLIGVVLSRIAGGAEPDYGYVGYGPAKA